MLQPRCFIIRIATACARVSRSSPKLNIFTQEVHIYQEAQQALASMPKMDGATAQRVTLNQSHAGALADKSPILRG